MRSIVSWSARFRVIVLGIAVAVMVIGGLQLSSAPVDVLPEYGPPVVEVQTEALGLSAEEVEQLITVPLEADLLNGVAWLDSIESKSVQSLSSIVMTFEPGTDPIRARQMVSERLTQAHALPNVSRPPVMLQPLSSANRLAMVSLSSNDLSLIDLSVLARWTIRPRLMGVPGVANVAIWGQRERQVQVLVDPERLAAAHVTLEDVVEATGNSLWVSPLTFLEASTPGTGGFIDTPNQRLGVQHILPIDSADELGRIALTPSNPDAPAGLRLSDVADVVEDHQPLIGDAIVNHEPGLLLVVEKFPEANTVAVTAAVEDALAAMAPGLSGVEIDSTVFRPATFIESAIGNLGLAIIIGLILVAAIIAMVFLEWRAALVSLVSIPVSVTVGAVVLQLAGATLNAMVVAGFVAAIAVVIDDAVITTAEIMRQERAESGATRDSRIAAAVRAVVNVRSPLVYATLGIMLASAPLFFIGDVTGALLPALLAAYLAAIGASLVVALTVAPALASLLVGRGLERREPRLLAALQGPYRVALTRLFSRPLAVLGVAGAATVGVVALSLVAMAPRLAAAGAPDFQTRDLLVQWDAPPGTSHTEMDRIISAASRELSDIDGVQNVGAHVGRAITSDQVVGISSGEIWVSMAPEADYTATRAAISSVIAGYPGLLREVGTYEAAQIARILGTSGDDLTVRIFGQDLDVMRAKATEIRDLMADVDGVSAAAVEPQVDEATIEISVDLDAAAAVGLKPGDIRRDAAALLSGINVGSLFEQQKVFEVVVWGTPEMRSSLTAIQNLPIGTPDGGVVALSDIADVRVAPSPTTIRRDAVQRVIDIGATVEGRDIGAVMADVNAAIRAVEFPLESHAELLPFTAERQDAQLTLLGIAASALVGIFLLLQAAFVSWRLAALVFMALPATLAGGIVIAALIGDGASIGITAGLIAVLGLGIRSGMLQVDHYRRLQRDAGEQFGPGLVLRGAQEQLGPMLATTLATAAAFAPFAVLGARAGLEVVHPMALVVLGGLVSSTLVNLFVVPSLFLRSGPSPEHEAQAITIEQHEPQVIGA
jgi:Cu/Ag efflux pump CusA